MGRKKKPGTICIDWIEQYCRVPEGQHIGRPVKLREWQKRELRRIYDNPHGTRRAIISFGRKNGKTSLAAFLLLLHLCGPMSRYNSQLYSTAQSREQAAVLFKLAAKIVRMSPDLNRVVIIRDTRKELECPKRGTLYVALSKEAKYAFGLSPVFTVHDELGQVSGPTSELYDAVETATGAQDQPLSVIISTQSPTDADLLSMLIDDALRGSDPCTICSLYSAPKDDDPFDEATIRKANPAYGDFLNKKETLAQAEDARRMPSKEANFRNLILNQRIQASNPFISRTTWQSCNEQPYPIDEEIAFAGLDLSSTNDLTALIEIAKIKDQWSVRSTFWLPQVGLRERSRADRVPYDVWHRQGHLSLTPGKSVNYDFVANHLRERVGNGNLKKVAFDRWAFQHLRAALLREGESFTAPPLNEAQIEAIFVPFGQGYKSMSPALRSLEEAILAGNLRHGDHPVLSMCAANAVVTSDPAGNRKLDRLKANGRIDGMIALAMAFSIATEATEEKPPEYQMFFV